MKPIILVALHLENQDMKILTYYIIKHSALLDETSFTTLVLTLQIASKSTADLNILLGLIKQVENYCH